MQMLQRQQILKEFFCASLGRTLVRLTHHQFAAKLELAGRRFLLVVGNLSGNKRRYNAKNDAGCAQPMERRQNTRVAAEAHR